MSACFSLLDGTFVLCPSMVEEAGQLLAWLSGHKSRSGGLWLCDLITSQRLQLLKHYMGVRISTQKLEGNTNVWPVKSLGLARSWLPQIKMRKNILMKPVLFWP